MVSKRPKTSFGLGNLTLFGFNLDELVKNVSGHSLEEIANNPKLAQEIREQLQKEHPETQSFEKKFGNTSVSYRVTKRQLGTKSEPRKVEPKITKTLTITKPEEFERQLKEKEEQDKVWKEEEETLFKKTRKRRKK